jgi:1-aminocyclopropane-1-carboxylate deaminase
MKFKDKIRPVIQSLQLDMLEENKVEAGVLRLDLIHPEISGNKWYKLKEYLKEAGQLGNKTIVTFGGAFSNHILATAAACREEGFGAAGIIRREQPKVLSPTLLKSGELGMDLFFVSGEAYKSKSIPDAVFEKYPDAYIIDEGGYGSPGMIGAKSILEGTEPERYTHIMAAVGTGTTLAGLTEAATGQQVVGVSVLKNNLALAEQVSYLLSPGNKNRFQLLHDYHFGGYAKYTGELVRFMNHWYQQTGIPSDFVYTGKLFYAFHHLCGQRFFAPGSRVLVVHSGGLQGNCSLNKGVLLF